MPPDASAASCTATSGSCRPSVVTSSAPEDVPSGVVGSRRDMEAGAIEVSIGSSFQPTNATTQVLVTKEYSEGIPMHYRDRLNLDALGGHRGGDRRVRRPAPPR